MTSGVVGLREALKATNQMIGVQASNLVRSQIPGSHEIRASLTSTDTLDFGKGGQASGAGIAVNGTLLDMSQGAIEQTKFTTDLAIGGKGFFVLFNNKGEYYYSRRGDFHFDASGNLVDTHGLFVASFDPKTNQLEKTTVEINPIVSALGEKILEELHKTPDQLASQLATTLGQTPATINAELAVLKVNDYVHDFSTGGNTYFNHNLGKVGDQVDFDYEGFVINETRGLRKGNQLALAVFPNEQGLVAGKYAGEVYSATDAAAPHGIPDYVKPGDLEAGAGSIRSMALEGSTSQVPNSLVEMGIWQRTFTSTTAAMKTFLAAWDDLISVFKG